MTEDGFEAPGDETPAPPETAQTPPVSASPGTTFPSAHDPETQPVQLPPINPDPERPHGDPTASYALGALAGNPHLGTPPGSGFGPPSPPASAWPPPPSGPPESPTVRRRHAARIGAVVGAGLALIGGGIAVGHSVWTPTANPASSASGNGSGSGSGSGSGNGNGSGSSGSPFQGSPFGGYPGSGGGSPFGNQFNGGSSSSGSSTGSGPSDASSIASKVDPGLVDINTTLGYQSDEAAGTGIVISSNGEILTNNHVIDGATSISVTDVGNHKTYSASVVGYDRTKDIAVLQLHNASGLQTASTGSSANLAVGQQVVGVGNAGGTGGTPSYAGGTITALNQSITASDEGDGSSEQLSGLIQTNANIQAGDSGGALVDTSGDVVGVDTAASAGFSFQSNGSSGDEGFAIPINAAISIAKQIEAGNASSTVHIGETAFLGVEVESASQANGGPFGNGSGNQSQSGAVVAGVVTSSPAQEAGLSQGDVITSVNSTTVGSADALTSALEPFHPGNKVTIGWTDSSGNSQHATVQLTSGPPQ
jgi:S1-C subfamily serine protease